MRSTIPLLAVILLLLSRPQLEAQAIEGHLLDRESGDPIVAATLTLLDAQGEQQGGTLTDSLGAFSLSAPGAGSYRLRITRLGYAEVMTETFELRRGQTLSLDLGLSAAAVLLEALTVTVRAEPRKRWLERRGFYERQQRGLGSFLLREHIEARRPRDLVEVFRGVRGFRVVANARGHGYVLTGARGGGAGGACLPDVYLDGVPLTRLAGDRLDVIYSVLPEHVEAIEAYSGPASIPPQYNLNRSACSVVLIWTR